MKNDQNSKAMQNAHRLILIVVGVISLTSCASPERTEYLKGTALSQMPSNWEGEVDQQALEVTSLKELINDKNLLDYIEQVLENNISLKQSVLDTQLAKLQQVKASGKKLPAVNFTATASRDPQLDTDTQTTNNQDTYSAEIGLSWELDLWGKLSDRADAASETAKASEYDMKAVHVSLTAQAIRDWAQLALELQLETLDQHRISSLKHNEKAISERYSNGIGELGDLEAARTATAEAEAALVSRQQRVDQLKRRMRVSGGQFPTVSMPLNPQILDISLPKGDLPAVILGKRPDVLAAFKRAVAADKRYFASYKSTLPTFSIDLRVGALSPNLGDLFSGGPVWRFISSLTAPLLDSSGRSITAKQNNLIAGRAWLLYRSIILNALLEVEDGLQNEQTLKRQEAILERALKHANNNYEQFKNRYINGLTDIVTLHVAERSAFSARTSLLETRNKRQQNRVNLAVALGIGL